MLEHLTQISLLLAQERRDMIDITRENEQLRKEYTRLAKENEELKKKYDECKANSEKSAQEISNNESR